MSEQQAYTFMFGAACLVAGWAFNVWLKGSGEKSAAFKEQEKRIAALEMQVAAMDFKVTPLWAKVQKALADDLHHPSEKHAEMDDLLEKLEALEIDEPETARLKELLIHRTQDKTVSESERKSAEIMATVMDKVLVEANHEGELEKVELVGETKSEKSKGESD